MVPQQNTREHGLFEDIDERLDYVRDHFDGRGTKFLCPAHNDRNPSLGIHTIDFDDIQVISLKCFAECSEPEILEAAGLTHSDLWGRPVFDYHDADGTLLYHHAHKKQFFHYENGERVWGRGHDPVLYNRPAVLEARENGETVFIFEGERDVETGKYVEVTGTTSGGAKSWTRPEFADDLEGADIMLVPDSDPEGAAYAKKVARSIYGKAKSISILDLPGQSDGEDITDWLNRNGNDSSGISDQELFSVTVDQFSKPWIPEDPPFSKNGHGSASNASNASNASDFEHLIEMPEAAEFPLSALCVSIRQFVREAARSIGCPVDYVGVSTLAALSAAVGDTRRIRIKRDWYESGELYAMIIGLPSSKKSPAMKIALKPVRDRQAYLKDEYLVEKEIYLSDLEEWERQKKKRKDDEELEPKPQKPVFQRTYADDTTVERLADILNDNPRGIVLTKDELSGWLGGMNQYKQGGKGSDRQFWLTVHANQPVAVDRKSLEEPVIVPRPFVAIIGGIQPDVLPDFGKDRGDGLIDRFIATYPEPVKTRWTDDEVSDEAHLNYRETMEALYDLEHRKHNDELFPATVEMSPAAKDRWVEHYDELHEELETPGFPVRLAAAWGKLEAYRARLALILAMARVVELRRMGQYPIEQVALEDMEGAIQLVDYFKNHIRRAYTGLYGSSTSERLAADIRDFLVTLNGFSWEGTATQLHETLPSDFKPERPEDLAKLVRTICKRTPALEFEELKRVDNTRPFRITLKIAGNAGSAGRKD